MLPSVVNLRCFIAKALCSLVKSESEKVAVVVSPAGI